MYILVFKTNIRFKKDLQKVKPWLGSVASVLQWNVDQQDVDKVLRIETLHPNPHEIISTVKQAGYFCEELPD